MWSVNLDLQCSGSLGNNAERCQDKLNNQLPKMGELIKKSEVKKIEDVVRRKELEKENEELKAMLPKDEKMTDKKVVVSISSKKETEIRFFGR